MSKLLPTLSMGQIESMTSELMRCLKDTKADNERLSRDMQFIKQDNPEMAGLISAFGALGLESAMKGDMIQVFRAEAMLRGFVDCYMLLYKQAEADELDEQFSTE